MAEGKVAKFDEEMERYSLSGGLGIDWDAYKGVGLEGKECALLREYTSQQSLEDRNDLLAERGQLYVQIFSKVLSTVSTPVVLKTTLAMVSEMLQQEPGRAALFNQLDVKANSTLIRLMFRSEDEFVKGCATQILGILLRDVKNAAESDLNSFFNSVNVQLTKKSHEQQNLLNPNLSALKEFLKEPAAQIVYAKQSGIFSLMDLTSNPPNEQTLYLVCFCIWLLTYNKELHDELRKHEVVRRLAKILKTVMREKIIRVCLSALSNLLNQGDFNKRMVSHGIPKTLETLQGRKFKDSDIPGDLVLLDKRLGQVVQDLSSFEMYAAEVRAGALSWTPVHSVVFWRENYHKFEDNNFELIRTLIGLLQGDNSPLVYEVVCYDLGEFIRFHPDGKFMLQKLGGKEMLLRHMESDEPKVSRQALVAVQKLMVENWESLSTAGGLGALVGKD